MGRIWCERPVPEQYRHLAGDVELVWRGPQEKGMQGVLRSMAGAQGVIASAYVRYDGELFDRMPELLVVSRTGIGVDGVAIDEATERGVVVCNTPDVPSIATAEFTIALLLYSVKRLGRCARQLQREERLDYFSMHDATELNGKQLGLVGLGRIGGRVARIALAFEMKVNVYDPFISQARADELGVQRVDSLEQLLGMSDIVSLHLPSTAETRELINAGALAQMKPGALLVNAARGTLVDEAALLAALNSGQLSGYASDVFAQEPPPHTHPLVQHPNVVCTPHVAGATVESKAQLWPLALQQALQVMKGERPPHVVNPDVWARRRGA